MKRRTYLFVFILLIGFLGNAFLIPSSSTSTLVPTLSGSDSINSSSAFPRTPPPWLTNLQEGPSFVPGRVLLRFRKGVDIPILLKGFPLELAVPDIHVYSASVPEGQEKTWVRLFKEDPRVEYAELDHYARAYLIPNDPLWKDYQWYMQKINAPQAWEITTGSSQIKVAILDTGIDPTHPEFQGKIAGGYNAIDQTDRFQDPNGHGTHVAGLVGAIGNNREGIAGMGWDLRLLGIQVLGPSGEGSDSSIARGITWAARNGARVINLSLGSPFFSQTVANAVRYALGQGALVIAAAGNEYLKGNPPSYPAALKEVMAVGATDYRNRHASYSTAHSNISVVAPGGDPFSINDADPLHWILSTWRTRTSLYQMAAGTSQSAPLVSGLAALLWSVDPTLTPNQVRGIIEQTAVDLGDPGKDIFFGWGLIDAGAALNKVAPPPTEPLVKMMITEPVDKSFVSGKIAIRGNITGDPSGLYRAQFGPGEKPTNWFDIGDFTSNGTNNLLGYWDTTQVNDGLYTLRVAKLDSSGKEITSSQVQVVVDNTPPEAKIVIPSDGEVLWNAFTLTGKINDAFLENVSLEIGSGTDPSQWVPLTMLSEEPSSQIKPLAFWNPGTFTPGWYTLRLTARDRAGNISVDQKTVLISPWSLGDANGDGQVNIADAILALRMVVGLEDNPLARLTLDLSPQPGTEGRPFGDGQITVTDALMVLRKILSLP